MRDELREIIPVPQPEIEDTFATYQVTSKFYQEVQSREAISRYCDWYYTTAEVHKQELQQMRGNLTS